jgi:hypothetical protein
MKKRLLIIILVLTIKASFGQEFTDLKGDYLGQTLPGDTPVVFAPGLVSDSTLGHSATFFSPDGNEVYWCTRENQNSQLFTYRMRRINNRWTMPEVFCPLGDTVHYCDPHITPDGKRIIFSSSAYNKFNVWSQEIIENGEGKVHNISDDIGVNYMHLQSTITNSGTLYFLAVGWNDNESSLDIMRSQFKDGTYQAPELLPTTINSDSMDWNPFIAADESYLIFASKRLKGQLDLYISFRDKATDTWSEAINIGEKINTDVQEGFPTVSPDGKYLFFTRYNQEMSMDVFWVSANFIDHLREKSKVK